jgi:hypothetical protein
MMPRFYLFPDPRPSVGVFNVPAVADCVRVPIAPRLAVASLPGGVVGMDYGGRLVLVTPEPPGGRG